MNLDRARILLSKLSIKHRDLNVSVPYIFNPNQIIAHNMVKAHYEKHKNVRAIILKARRVGMSSYWDSILFTHALARPQAHANIVAHLKDVSEKGLFRVPRDLASELNEKVQGAQACEIYARQIKFHHADGDSLLDIATAGSQLEVGEDLPLLLSIFPEAALYPGQDSFLSILPAVSKADDTIIAIESTAQGRVGIGQTFFDHWQSAKKVGRQWNGYLPIFLSWLDDPACWSDSPAEDAPATDLERELMGNYGATREQIAWMRFVLEGECAGSEAKFSQEYPWTDNVAFTSTGDPAFSPTEIKYAYSTRREQPLERGTFFRDSGQVKFVKDPRGKWLIYEHPKPKCHYYLGVDCARGMEAETGRATGDFTAVGIVNGSTGNAAAKFSEWVDPDIIADEVDKAGRYFNKGMVNIELTGNLGLWAQKRMRDHYMYPNLYVWRGKDDKKTDRASSHSLGWETTPRTRDLLFSSMRGKLRDGMKNLPGGFAPIDPELIEQMDVATMSPGQRWEVEKGHDDVIVSFMLAIIAWVQYPPPIVFPDIYNVYESKQDRQSHAAQALKAAPDLQNALKRDLKFVFRKERKQVMAVRGGY